MVNLSYGEESVVSYLPLSHVAAQVIDIWICMRFAGTVYFADPDALKVRAPHVVQMELSIKFSLFDISRSFFPRAP